MNKVKINKGDLSVEGRYSKARISGFVESIMEPFINGEQDALKAYVDVKAQKEFIDQLEKGLKPLAMQEADMYGGDDDKVISGVSFSVVPGSTTYSYSHDEVWSALDEEIKRLTQLKKDREEAMRAALKVGGSILDEGTGEVIAGAKVKSAGSSTLRCIIPKE